MPKPRPNNNSPQQSNARRDAPNRSNSNSKSPQRLPDDSRTLDLTGVNDNRSNDNRDVKRQPENRTARRATSRRGKGKTKTGDGKNGRLWRLSIWNAIFLGVLWLIERFVAEKTAVTTFITYIPQHGLGLANGCLLLWAMWRKEPKTGALNLAALGFFVFAFLGFNVPSRAWTARMSTHAAAPSKLSREIPLRVMTYNVLRGQAGIKGLIATIQAARPDVLCLQESDAWGGLGPIPSVEIARHLPGRHLARQGELAIVSRFPIVSSRAHTLRGATGVQEVVLKIGGRDVSIFNTHFSVRIGADVARRSISMTPQAARTREMQLNNLLQATKTARAPFIITGDFNTPPRGLVYHALSSRFDNAWRAAGTGLGYSFPSRLPLLRIDHIWMSRNVRATNCRVLSSRASDHRSVIADLRVGAR